MDAQRIPGMALVITRADTIIYTRSYGTASNGEPTTDQTQFRLASLSKSFTAAAVLQRVDAGKIDLDAPIMTYLPEFTLADPIVAKQIPVRQLFNHTSGLAHIDFACGLAQQQRFFGYIMLLCAMPDVLVWLGACAPLVGLNGVARLVMVFRFRAQRHRQKHFVSRSA